MHLDAYQHDICLIWLQAGASQDARLTRLRVPLLAEAQKVSLRGDCKCSVCESAHWRLCLADASHDYDRSAEVCM